MLMYIHEDISLAIDHSYFQNFTESLENMSGALLLSHFSLAHART